MEQLCVPEPASVYLVEDEALIGADLAAMLEAAGYKIAGTTDSATEAMIAIPSLGPDLVIMDIRIHGNLDGIETALALRPLLDVPVVFLTAHADRNTLARAAAAGPYGYITKPMREESVIATVESALGRRRYEVSHFSQLRQMAFHDHLTGLPNRLFLKERLAAKLEQDAFACSLSTFCLCDLDRFKTINDTYGHDHGDRVLQLFADVLREHAEHGALLCRMGGDEFAAVFHELRPVDAAARLEPVRAGFKAAAIREGYSATCSFGVAPLDSGSGIDDAIRAADHCLYEAKRLGGDCISLRKIRFSEQDSVRADSARALVG